MKKNGIFLIILLLQIVYLGKAIEDENALFQEFILQRGFLREEILEKFAVKYTSYISTLYKNHFFELIIRNPNPFSADVKAITNYLIYIIELFYILAIITIGIYLIFFSGTYIERSKVKSYIPRIILGMALVPLSPFLLNILFTISNLLTIEIFSFSPENPIKIFIDPIESLIIEFSLINKISSFYAVPLFIFASILVLLNLIFFLMRYIVVNLLTLIFPLTLFLYSFSPFRDAGKRLTELTISWTFIQVLIAITIVSGYYIIITSAIQYRELKFFLEISAQLSIIIVSFFTIIMFRDVLPK